VAVGASAVTGILVTAAAATGALLVRSMSSKDDLDKSMKKVVTKN